MTIENENLDPDKANKEEIQEENLDQANKEDPREEEELSPEELEEQEAAEEKATQDQEAEETSRQNKSAARQRVSKRVDDLNSKVDASNDAVKKVEEENATLRTQAENYKLLNELDQQDRDTKKKVALPEKPKLEDFDDDETDPRYVKAVEEWQDAKIDARIDAGVEARLKDKLGGLEKSNKEKTLRDNVTRQQEAHYQRVDDSGDTNYDKAEKAVIAILGQEGVRDIIELCPDDSDKIITNLGSNPELTEEIKRSARSGNIAQTIRLVERASQLKRAKPKFNQTPAPDTKLSGGSPSQGDGKDDLKGVTFR